MGQYQIRAEQKRPRKLLILSSNIGMPRFWHSKRIGPAQKVGQTIRKAHVSPNRTAGALEGQRVGHRVGRNVPTTPHQHASAVPGKQDKNAGTRTQRRGRRDRGRRDKGRATVANQQRHSNNGGRAPTTGAEHQVGALVHTGDGRVSSPPRSPPLSSLSGFARAEGASAASRSRQPRERLRFARRALCLGLPCRP